MDSECHSKNSANETSMSDDLFREIDKLATKLPTWLQPDDAQLVCQKSLKGT